MKLPPCSLPILDRGANYAGKTFTNDLIAAVNVKVITAGIFAKQAGVIVAGDET
ncbi:MAG: hypothetical protein WBD61_02355 [Desulfobulbales bacterium]|jgi:hypothetical protein